MSPEQLFSIVNAVAAVSWLLMAARPRARWATDIVAGVVVPATLAVMYIGIVGVMWRSSSGGFSSLADVATLFANPWLLLAGWVHYLAFDLLVGAWEVRDARTHHVPHLFVLPCLALTFLFGPAGWLLYLGVRALPGRRA